MCKLSTKKKCLLAFFFFTLSHSHYVSFYLFIQTAPLKLKLSLSLCLALSGTHTKIAENSSLTSALFTRPNDPCLFLLSFLFLRHVLHALHHSSLREVRHLPCFGHFSINERASFEDFWKKLINEL